MSPIRRSTISTRSSTGNNPFRNRISANPRKRGFRGFFMQAGKESRRQGRKGRTVEGRSTGTAAEGPERRRKKGRDGDGRKTERRRKDRGGDGRTGAATEESPAMMTERPRREKWRKTATTKGRTVTAEKPGGDDRRTGTAEGGDFPTFFRRKRKNTRIFAALDP